MRILKIIGVAALLVLACGIATLWWLDRPPQRPPNLSADALFIERPNVPFKVGHTGEWLDCWFDEREGAARCKLTNMNGWLEFEDVFIPYSGQARVSKADLVLDRRGTGTVWGGAYGKGSHYPIVYLTNGDILLPRSEYERAKKAVP